MFHVVGLQVVHIRASLWGTIVKVVVDHIVHNVATQTTHKNANPDDIGQNVAQDYVETANH